MSVQGEGGLVLQAGLGFLVFLVVLVFLIMEGEK